MKNKPTELHVLPFNTGEKYKNGKLKIFWVILEKWNNGAEYFINGNGRRVKQIGNFRLNKVRM